MLFMGDMVYQHRDADPFLRLKATNPYYMSLPKILNLESTIDFGATRKNTKGIALSSSATILDRLQDLNVKCVTLSNNHIFDYEIDINQVKLFLKNNGIGSTGAGHNLATASEPFIDHEHKVVVLSFGWNVIRCIYASENKPGVNPYEYDWVLSQLAKYRREYRDYLLIVSVHWNYEFEQYPQPADRQFCRTLIANGADAIVGHHAHIIQGHELIDGKPVFYGLGNFYFPNARYGDFNLCFPEAANTGLSVDIEKSKLTVYLTKLVDNAHLEITGPMSPGDCEELNNVSGFQGLSDGQYYEFFKENRVKRKALPIYRSYKNTIINSIFDTYVMCRQIPVDLLGRVRKHA